MNTDLLAVMRNLKLRKQDWSPYAEEILAQMQQLAQHVEDTKYRYQYSFTVCGRNGWHFLECGSLHPFMFDKNCKCINIYNTTQKFIMLLKTLGIKECGEYLYKLMLFHLGEKRNEG